MWIFSKLMNALDFRIDGLSKLERIKNVEEFFEPFFCVLIDMG